MAERLFRARVGSTAPIVASSAGVNAMIGHPMDGPSAQVMRELGADPQGHVGQRLDVRLAAAADLVLTAERSHRSVIIQADPLVFRRTFTLREFARLGSGFPRLAGSPNEDTLRARVSAVARQRGAVEPVHAGADDIGDPYGASMELARLVGLEVSDAVDATLAALGLPRRPSVG